MHTHVANDIIANRAIFAAADTGWPHTLVILHSFSKEFALPGYRVGAVVASAELNREVTKLLDCVAICAPRIGQEAAWAGLTQARQWRRDRARAAAEKLNTTQPAVSQRIASLEGDLGVKLFERDTRGVKLTGKGHELLSYAERMLDLRRDMMQAAREQNVMCGTVRIGVAETIVQTWLSTLIEHVHAAYPELVPEIERRGRFVQEQELGALSERAGNHHALFLAAAERAERSRFERLRAGRAKSLARDGEVRGSFKGESPEVWEPSHQHDVEH